MEDDLVVSRELKVFCPLLGTSGKHRPRSECERCMARNPPEDDRFHAGCRATFKST